MVDQSILHPRVVLREKSLNDAGDDYRWRTDDELAGLDATLTIRLSFEEYLKHYEEELRYPTPWVRRYSIDTLEGEHIGNCMCYDIDTVSGEGEVGIMIGDRRYWDGGFGSEAMAYLVEDCFGMPSLTRLYLHTLEWNARARRAFAKCGFRELRPVRRAGKPFVLMEMLRSEWDVARVQWPALRDGVQGPVQG
jgi:RimJ/RimL family protein N-acetyltransferase